jgi:hypothetical protein
MSANDLLGADLPSDSESDDEDYVSEGSGSSSESSFEVEDEKDGRAYKKEIRRHKVARHFQNMKSKELARLEAESHPDVMVDPLMLEFQRPQKDVPNKSLEFVLNDLKKYSNVVKHSEPIDVGKYKVRARSDLVASGDPSVSSTDVAKALAGLSASRVEVEEEVRFAGEVVKLKKSVEKSSSHAAKFERKKRATEEASLGGGSLGGLQAYLNQIKSHRAVTSVEKSATDWNKLKLSSEGMDQSLRAERGFLEKKAFLVRSDLIEDDLRREARRKRLLEQPPSNLP